MGFVFRFSKTAQAAAVLLKAERNRRTNFMRLLKLLYIADRQCLKRTGRPITGDSIAAMERGPVLSRTYDLIKGTDILAPKWSAFFARDRYDIELIQDPGVGELSRFEIELLQEVSQEHANMDEWELVEHTHGFPEWKKNEPPPGSSRLIPLEDVLEAVGRSDDIASVLDDARDESVAERLFGPPPQ